MKLCLKVSMAALVVASLTGSAMAEELTPWGAIKGGNKEGTIPAYTGKITPPASFDPKEPWHRPDPFANEKPILVITAANAAQYDDKLSVGVKEMLKKYPNFRLDVYPSHRTAAYPDYVIENSKKNATACKTTNNGLNLEGCYAGIPFPTPKTGNEAMWNHLLKYDSYAFWTQRQGDYVVDSQGAVTMTGASAMWVKYPIYDPKRTTPMTKDDVYMELRSDTNAPAYRAGEKTVLRDSIDMLNIGRKAYQYLPGQRRVKLSPDLAYDTPNPSGAGLQVMDEGWVFMGALDRYDFKLVGKRELYIPYNTYKLHDSNECPITKITSKNVMNPDCVRWELHRVWEVEATLKPGKRHVYTKRTFYWDEDLPGAGLVDNYDATGKIYRVTMSMPMSMYETKANITDEAVTFDMPSGAYVIIENPADSVKSGYHESEPKPEAFFLPEAMAGSAIR
jgi:hypothetical protein